MPMQLSIRYLQGPLSRFGDTAANAGTLSLLESYELTAGLNVGLKTVVASAAAASFRILLMPIDATKTIMQVLCCFCRSSVQLLKALFSMLCSLVHQFFPPLRSRCLTCGGIVIRRMMILASVLRRISGKDIILPRHALVFH